MTDAESRSLRTVLAFAAAGVLLLAVAFALTVTAPDTEFVAFLAMILGGWSLGVAFVRGAARRARGGLIALVVGTAVSAGLAVALSGLRGENAVGAAAIFVLAMAALPAAGWIALSLLGRVLSLLPGRTPTSARSTPDWEADPERDGAVVRVRAVPLSMRALTIVLTGATLTGGAGAAAVMIALDSVAPRLGARVIVLAIGLLVALPVFLLFRAAVRRRAAAYTLGFGRTELRVDGPRGTEWFPYRQIDVLRWRTDSEYARLELRVGDDRRTLLVGQAAPAPGRNAELPPLSRRTVQALQGAGLTVHPGRVLSFRRAPSEVAGPRAGSVGSAERH